MPRRPVSTGLRAASAAVVVGLLAAACGSGSGSGGTERAAERTSTTRRTTTTSSSTTTTVAPTTTTAKAAAAPAPGLGMGASGPAVLALQQRLVALHYDVPKVDGNFGAGTMQAVMAFQKVNGMARTGRATDDVVAKLASAGSPGSMIGAGGTHIEVDVARQVLFFFEGGSLSKIVAVSTGSGQRFCVKNRCATAVTPGGAFRVRSKVRGWQEGELGRLYAPSYFNGNIAVHGALSVPAYPASHGCVRVPMTSADWLFAVMNVGMPVYVVNGPNVPAPFSDGNSTPSTTAPPVTTTAPPVTTTTAPPVTTTSSTTTTTTAPPPTTTTVAP